MIENEFLNTNAAEMPIMRLLMLADIAADVLDKTGNEELAGQLRTAIEEV